MNQLADTVKSNKTFCNDLNFSELSFTNASIDAINCNSSVIQNLVHTGDFSASELVSIGVTSSDSTVDLLITDILNCQTLNTNVLTVPEYVITTLFADKISAAQEVSINTYVPETHTTSGLTTSQKLAIAFGVITAVALIAIIVLSVGTATPAVAPVAGFVFTEASVAGEAALLSAIAVENAVVVGAATAVTASSVAVGVAGITVVASTLGVAGSLAAHAVLSNSSPDPPNPTLRPKVMNSTYGKSFLSDIIFGTTSYRDASAAYVNFLLVQNELHGSYALPRIISFNPQLGFFDDSTDYGGVRAYLSICTNTPYTTLRYEDTGNLAIYTSTVGAPVWESSTQVSSLKYKKNIQTLKNPLEKLRKIEGVRFKYKEDSKEHLGVIAQQVRLVLEEAVSGDEQKGYRIHMEKLIPLIIEGMKELYWAQEKILKYTDQ